MGLDTNWSVGIFIIKSNTLNVAVAAECEVRKHGRYAAVQILDCLQYIKWQRREINFEESAG